MLGAIARNVNLVFGDEIKRSDNAETIIEESRSITKLFKILFFK